MLYYPLKCSFERKRKYGRYIRAYAWWQQIIPLITVSRSKQIINTIWPSFTFTTAWNIYEIAPSTDFSILEIYTNIRNRFFPAEKGKQKKRICFGEIQASFHFHRGRHKKRGETFSRLKVEAAATERISGRKEKVSESQQQTPYRQTGFIQGIQTYNTRRYVCGYELTSILS